MLEIQCARLSLLAVSFRALLALFVSHAAAFALLASLAAGAAAQEFSRIPNPPANLASLPGDLRAIAVPGPSNLDEFVKDPAAAVRLGKAFFWDMQVGSDDKTACASCHFRAGADPRSKNQLNPGLNVWPAPDKTFSKSPNYQLSPADFPFRRLSDPANRASTPLADTNDVVSSQGVHYLAPDPNAPWRFLPDQNGFIIGGVNTRQVEPRNAPSVINAVFNHRNFWDGRAENIFNGVNHVGERDPNARVVRMTSPWSPELVTVRLADSSLASQAVAPIVSTTEMSKPGQTIYDLGRELARRFRARGEHLNHSRPLAYQRVHPSDSVLGPLSRSPQPGLTVPSYDLMIRDAFKNQWWDSRKLVRVDSNGAVSFVNSPARDGADYYPVMVYNFALFFGLSVQMYESTLVSDDTPWDRFRREHPSPSDPALNPWTNTSPAHITREALFGAHLFNDRTRGPSNLRCSNCHEENEMTDASARRVKLAAEGAVRNRDGNVIDKGFNNIGVRRTEDDVGVGAKDAFGPISRSLQRFSTPPSYFDGAAVTKGFGVDGAFKIPSLRNVALTAPYFHNGGMANLRQVMEFYSRGGNFAQLSARDGTPIEPLGVPNLTGAEINALIAFLNSLTDERVLYRKAPFDHPQLFVPNGHRGNERFVVNNGRGLAMDEMLEIPEVGAQGGPPLPGFLEGPFGPRGR